ncbi:hypothetical protein ACFFX1_55115 [Dactylosporangium sucinum]|nr:hypothetical protein [Dactylosporangium sucinum]
MMPDRATAVIEYLDGTSSTLTATTGEGAADLRRFAETAHREGKSQFDTAYVDGVQRPVTINHVRLAAVRLVTS